MDWLLLKLRQLNLTNYIELNACCFFKQSWLIDVTFICRTIFIGRKVGLHEE